MPVTRHMSSASELGYVVSAAQTFLSLHFASHFTILKFTTFEAHPGIHSRKIFRRQMPENRRMSSESGMSLMTRRTQSSRGGRRLRPSESVGSSIASNLHRVSAASDLNKVSRVTFFRDTDVDENSVARLRMLETIDPTTDALWASSIPNLLRETISECSR